MVPADSRRIPRAPRYSGYRKLRNPFAEGAITLYGRTFQNVPLRIPQTVMRSYNPARAGTRAVWAVPRSLATTGGITFCFLFLRVLRCFSSPRSPPPNSGGCPRCTRTGCPIQEPVDLRPLASPHGFSQLAAPFIAFLSHRHPPCALSCFLPCITCGPVRTRRAYLRLSRVICLFFSFVVPVCQSPTSPDRGARWRISESNR